MRSQLHISIAMFSLGALLLFAVPADVHAHGEEGMALSTTTEKGFVIDVDYGESSIQAGSIGRFDFKLFADEARTKPVDFSDLWVRIVQDDGTRGKTLYAGSVAKAEFGGTGFSFVFPEGGNYTLSVRYNDSKKDTSETTLGEAEFPLNVLRSYDENTFAFGMEFWVGLMAGLFGAIVAVLPLLLRSKKT